MIFLGGGSLFAIHNECESYNPRTNTWIPIAPMLGKRSRSGVTALRKMLYVVGGYYYRFFFCGKKLIEFF